MTTLVVLDPTLNDTQSPVPNSFVSIAEWREFYTLRNDDLASDADDDAICAALIFANDYMNQEFRMRFRGSLVKAFQPMTWPRRGVPIPDFFDPFFRNTNVPFEFRHTVFFGEDVVPTEVKEAQMLLARQSINAAGDGQSSLETTQGRVTRREKLGGLEVEYFGADGGGQRQTTLYWDALKRLQPYLRPTNVGTALRS